MKINLSDFGACRLSQPTFAEVTAELDAAGVPWSLHEPGAFPDDLWRFELMDPEVGRPGYGLDKDEAAARAHRWWKAERELLERKALRHDVSFRISRHRGVLQVLAAAVVLVAAYLAGWALMDSYFGDAEPPPIDPSATMEN